MNAFFTPHQHGVGASGYGISVAAWFVMMVLMMSPAVMPWLRMFGKMAGDAFPGRRRALLIAQFVGGYFVIWLLYSAVAAATQFGLQRQALLRMDLRAGAATGGALLLVAGVFQLTPLKEACLSHCRSPLSFFLTRWDSGPSGPFRMGARHGGWCVTCCWALMALSFVLGVMNLLWMGVLTAIVSIEQLAPGGRRWSKAFGLVFVAWGVWLIAAS